jgi:cobalt/nickel transport system ATP-binding protein
MLLSLVGILTPTSGGIFFEGAELKRETLADFRRHMGLVFQNPDDQLFMPFVDEDIAFGPRNFGIEESSILHRTEECLTGLKIERLRHKSVSKLSGGEKRLVALAGVLVMRPRVLLMDEPSSFLDPRARKRLIGVLSNLSQTMLLATHDMDMALDLCERTIILKEGKVYADGKTKEILQDEKLLDECDLEPPLRYSK